MTYHAVWCAVRKLAVVYDTQFPGNDFHKIRTHSGRASAITTLMGQGVSLPMGMKFARHKPGSLAIHLRYGQLTCADVFHEVKKRKAETASSSRGPPVVQPTGAGAAVAAAVSLFGTTMKDLVRWLENGHLTQAEFLKCKRALLARLPGQ